jgi:hypothetical protein
MREEKVPHEGQAAVGDVVHRVSVISSVTSTPSTSIWGSRPQALYGSRVHFWALTELPGRLKIFGAFDCTIGADDLLWNVQSMLIQGFPALIRLSV